MATSLIDADSLLAIDIGTVNTRAVLFDAVGGAYRFLAMGTSPTTMGAPLYDVSEGVRRAISEVQRITGRTLFDTSDQLAIPSSSDGMGVDMVAAVLSGAKPLRVVAVGLLEDVSLESAKRLALTTYADVVATVSLNDRRKLEKRLDVIMGAQPQVVVIAGGTENGASKSLMQLLDAVGVSAYLMPENMRPAVLFAGNQAVTEEVQSSLDTYVDLQIAPNIRPSLEQMQLEPAAHVLYDLYRDVHAKNSPGLQEVVDWTGGFMRPAATGFGRIVKYFSNFYKSTKGVLGVDIGAGATTIASAFKGELQLSVYSQLGMGGPIQNLLKISPTENIARWLPYTTSPDEIQSYLYQKSIYPASIPATTEELQMEHAIATEIMRVTLRAAQKHFPATAKSARPGLYPWLDPVLVTGSVLSNAPSAGQVLMMLLNGLDTTGITNFVLDHNNLLPVLGVTSEMNPVMTVQVIESDALMKLATVIVPVGSARDGSTVLRVRVQTANGGEQKVEVTQGEIVRIPLRLGQTASVHVQPLQRMDIGMGPGRSSKIEGVTGSALGIVIDARGRPLQFSLKTPRRVQKLSQWMARLGG